MASAIDIGLGRPFLAQLEFFLAKLALGSAAWDDIWQAAHDRFFIVAGALKADLIQDFKTLVDQAIAGKLTYEKFHDQFLAIAKSHGWVDWKGADSQSGQAWRTRLVYSTNIATSYAAGRYKQLTDPAYLERFPYWVYHHLDGQTHPRPLHESWNGLTLRWDHPFWQTHFPPNGWYCHCWVTSTDEAGYQKVLANGLGEPPAGWDALDPKTGAPVGIDRGWAYAPGASADTSLTDLISQKLIKLDAPIGAAMFGALRRVLLDEQLSALAAFVEQAAASMQPAGLAVMVSAVAPATVVDLAARGIELNDAAIWLRDSELIHALRDAKSSRGAVLGLDTWRNLPDLLNRAAVYLDTQDTALIYVFDSADGMGKIAVRVNYTAKIQGSAGREKITSNFIRSGGVIDARFNVLNEPGRYVLLQR